MPVQTRGALRRDFPPVPPDSTAAATQNHLELYLVDQNEIPIKDLEEPVGLRAYSSEGDAVKLAAEQAFFNASTTPAPYPHSTLCDGSQLPSPLCACTGSAGLLGCGPGLGLPLPTPLRRRFTT